MCCSMAAPLTWLPHGFMPLVNNSLRSLIAAGIVTWSRTRKKVLVGNMQFQRFVAKGFLRSYATQHGRLSHGLSMSVVISKRRARSAGVMQRFQNVAGVRAAA